MAALRPCPFIITALASSNLDRSQPRTRGIILPLDRSNSTLKISRAPPDRSSTLLKSNHGIRAHRGAAGDPVGPDPEELMRKYMTPEQQKIWDECMKIAKGPPDMPFREEIDILSEYWDKVRDEIFYDKSILHPGTASLSWSLCSKAHHAAVLASKVVDCALLRHGMDEISVHTTKQIMRTYVSVFVSTAEDSHHKKVRMETIFSFLGALQGVASISHILVQDTLALIGSKDTCSDYKIDESGLDRAHLEYQVEMNNLKDKLASAHRHGLLDLYKILTPTLHHAVARTSACVLKMIGTRKMALGHHLPGPPKAPDDS